MKEQFADILSLVREGALLLSYKKRTELVAIKKS